MRTIATYVKQLPLFRFLRNNKVLFHSLLRWNFWFISGVVLGFFFFVSFVYISYKHSHNSFVYPGVYINHIDFGGKTKEEVQDYFAQRNSMIQRSEFLFTIDTTVATISAKELDFGYDDKLLADQAFSVGRSSNALANASLMLQAFMYGVYLEPSYHYDEEKLVDLLTPIRKMKYIAPIDARFSFENGRVKEFRQSTDGQEVDVSGLKSNVSSKTLTVIAAGKPQTFTIPIPIKVLKPQLTTEKVNNMGIKELIGEGSSSFVGSIPNRIYNVALAATRLDGILVKPGETFSFGKALGDISTFTGYKQAYVIQNGRTVLGDGGGVCQVSTTLFRAVLNSGLPIVERNPHAYRVSYYEQDSGPGLDAAVYVPTVDFKFKNDTKHYILVKTIIDTTNAKLTFALYGTKDNRDVAISKPVISRVTSSPEPLYIDDPTLPKGELKQVDYAVPGATVYFNRTVKRDGKVLLQDTFSSYYRAWQAVYMKGTREG